MNLWRIVKTQAALALLLAAAMTQVAQAKPIPSNRAVGPIPSDRAVGPRAEAVQGPLAGPWYTPQERRSLDAFSNLTFPEQQESLRALDPAASARDESLKHQQLLRGLAATARDQGAATDSGFDWGEASVGGLGAVGIALLSAGGMLLAARHRKHKPAVL